MPYEETGSAQTPIQLFEKKLLQSFEMSSFEKHNLKPPQVFIDWVLSKQVTGQLANILEATQQILRSPFRGELLRKHLKRQIKDFPQFTVGFEWLIQGGQIWK